MKFLKQLLLTLWLLVGGSMLVGMGAAAIALVLVYAGPLVAIIGALAVATYWRGAAE